MLNKLILLLFVLKYSVGQEFLDLPEGSKCTRKGVNGVCANIYNCLNAAEDIKDKDYPAICTFRGKTPIICCTDCELVNDTRTMFISPTSGQWYWRNGEKARDKCIDYMQALDPCKGHFIGTIAKDLDPDRNCYVPRATAVGAAGGTDAERGQFPHMALLGYGVDIDSAQWLCGGTLISENYILTAGHCISSTQLGEVKYIALGILKRSDPPELWQKYDVKRIVTHPQYKPPSKYHDIALLETDRRVSFNDQVMPACLPYIVNKWDNTAEATGWGALGHRRELADTLQSVYLQEFNSTECSQLYPVHRHLRSGYDHDTQMCYGHRNEVRDTCEVYLQEFNSTECSQLYPVHRHLRSGYDHDTQMCYGHRNEVRDTCEGDSGGPLQNKNHISSCMYKVVGVTSYGRQCGFVGSSGMYTRVRHYLKWIEDTVWP